MTVWHLLINFNGRINRATYGIVAGVLLVVGLFEGLLIAPNLEDYGIAAKLVGGLFMLAAAWVHFAIGAKRLHDLNKSGWWQLVPFAYIIALVMAVAVSYLALKNRELATLALGLYAITLPLALWALWVSVQIFFFAGSNGDNRFGPPKKFFDFFGEEDELPSHLEPDGTTADASQVQASTPKRQPVVSPARRSPEGFGKRSFGTA